MSKYAAGIDFGTSNSTVAIVGLDGAPRMVMLEPDRFAVPSVMFFENENDQGVYFGTKAEQMNAEHPTSGRMMRAIKSILGTSLTQQSTKIGQRQIPYLEIIRDFLFEIKLAADIKAGENIDSVVLGRPVHFTKSASAKEDEMAEQALRLVAENIGFKNIAFQYEPIAAAFAHEQKLNQNEEKLTVVIDIGGGTSDISIVRLAGSRKNMFDRSKDILSNAGIRIGGRDFDEALSKGAFMPEFGQGGQYEKAERKFLRTKRTLLPIPGAPFDDLSDTHNVVKLYNKKTLNLIEELMPLECEPKRLHRMREVIINQLGHTHLACVEASKIRLSDSKSIKIGLDYLSDRPKMTVKRTEFENFIQKDVDAIKDKINAAVKDAGISADDVELVVLTGGSSQIPCIIDIANKMFPNSQISKNDEMTSVGMGLAYDANRRKNSGDWQ